MSDAITLEKLIDDLSKQEDVAQREIISMIQEIERLKGKIRVEWKRIEELRQRAKVCSDALDILGLYSHS